MKKITILFCLLGFLGYGQTIIPHGTLTLKTEEKIDFINLMFKGKQVVFNNVATNKEHTFLLADVKSIQGKTTTVEALKKKADSLALLKPVVVEDGRFRPGYPEGIYKTKADFINKMPVNTERIYIAELSGFENDVRARNPIKDICLFYYYASDSKVKNVFAVSYQGYLYFQVEAILDNRNKTDRAQTHDRKHEFARVIAGGENYFYTEAALANIWAQGFVYGAGGGMGGAIGGAAIGLSNSGPFSKDKGIVWDFKKQEFNIFKNCKDYNDFIKDKYPEGVQTCERQQPNLDKVREAIEKIK